MKFKCFRYLLLTFLLVGTMYGQDAYQRNEHADVLNYVFNLSLSDQSNEVQGETSITVDFSESGADFLVDLIGKSGKFGMTVLEVLEDKNEADYSFVDNKIVIRPTAEGAKRRTYSIRYKGIPEKGLVIDVTKFGQRSFFGDNWPNLARHWLPCVDHPYDKASVEFAVTAPEYYDVVATGKKIEESNIGDGFKLTRYVEPAPVATKVVTIGVTKFASMSLGNIGNTEVSAWVYPENRLAGFADFEEAFDILEFFIDRIGPFSYAKLANVQAKTQWGGLENAGNISYFEKGITGEKKLQGLMAHEIAHQWFGDSATEDSWNHVWLSEGFATYFAILYLEEVHGDERRKKELDTDKKEVIEYYGKNPSPIVDLSISDPRKVLNRNTYQKGGWLLNMLRHKLGDKVFWKGIRRYYKTYRDANASSEDFQKVMEEVSGHDLQAFFEQWLYVQGYPELKWNWKYRNGKLSISVKQVQKHYTFKFPVEFGIVSEGKTRIETLDMTGRSGKLEMELGSTPEEVLIDPGAWLLFEEK